MVPPRVPKGEVARRSWALALVASLLAASTAGAVQASLALGAQPTAVESGASFEESDVPFAIRRQAAYRYGVPDLPPSAREIGLDRGGGAPARGHVSPIRVPTGRAPGLTEHSADLSRRTRSPG